MEGARFPHGPSGAAQHSVVAFVAPYAMAGSISDGEPAFTVRRDAGSVDRAYAVELRTMDDANCPSRVARADTGRRCAHPLSHARGTRNGVVELALDLAAWWITAKDRRHRSFREGACCSKKIFLRGIRARLSQDDRSLPAHSRPRQTFHESWRADSARDGERH